MSPDRTKEDHLRMNRTAWDEGHRYLAARRKRNPRRLDELRKGPIDFTTGELELLGDVAGLDILQLSCGGDASQAFSLASMGAAVSACDFCEVAIAEAQETAAQIGVDIRFAVDDSQRLHTFADGLFDLVHVDGNLWVYEDLTTCCRNWLRVLRSGGRLFLHEGHPVTRCLREAEDGTSLRAVRAYGDRSPEYSMFRISDFVSETNEEVEFAHTLGDIIDAVAQAGFTIERMAENPADQASFRWQGMESLPHDIFVIARKP